MKEVYRLEITNWEKYNAKKKKGHESIMLSCRFFDDAKIMRLTPLQRLIYVRLLLVAGDFSSRSIEVHSEMIARSTGVPRQMVGRSLIALQENQLVTIENCQPLIEEKRREKTSKEKKIKEENKSLASQNPEVQEKKSSSSVRPKSKVETDEGQDLRRRIRDAYVQAYYERYKVDVVFNKEFNSKIKALSLRLGEEAVEVVKFYLTHNDSFYLKSTHSIGLCLRDCESLRTQMLRGRPITQTMVRSFEKTNQTKELFDRIEKEGI